MRLFRTSQRSPHPLRDARLTAVNFVADAVNRSLDLKEIADNAVHAIVAVMELDAGAVYIWERQRKAFHLFAYRGISEKLARQMEILRLGDGAYVDAVLAGETKVIEDFKQAPQGFSDGAVSAGFRSAVLIPIRSRGVVVGLLALGSYQARGLEQNELDLVETIANQIGVAVTNAQLYEAQLRENEKLNALLEVSTSGAQSLELEALLKRILRKSASLLNADAAYMVHYLVDTNEAEVVAATAGLKELIGSRFDTSIGLFGRIRAVRQGQVFSGEEVARDVHSPILRGGPARSVLAEPLVSRNELIGALGVIRLADAASDFDSSDLELMEAFASRAAVAIDNAQLLEDLQQKNELLQVLVDESHHRIKNNLQMISGLLQLQAEMAGADKSREYLLTAISRIQAIAQVHHLLTEEMPEKVDAHPLIGTIVNALVNSAPGPGKPPSVTLELEHVWLSAERAVPLALIVNEIVANSLLHGRPEAGQALHIYVECQRKNNDVRVVLSDNGSGFKEGKDWREFKGQGMNIVSQLAQVNLGGSVGITTRDRGVRAEVRFTIGAQTDSSAPKSVSPVASSGP